MAWQCVICGITVPQTSGPIGMYCKAHKHWRTRTCIECGTEFKGHRTTRYCSTECRPDRRRAPRTNLRWRQCAHCNRWFSNPARRRYCTDGCAREAVATAAGYRNRPCRRCGTPLGAISLVNYCDTCRRDLKRERKKTDLNRRSLNNHRQRARHYGVPYEPVHPLKVFARDRWQCGICKKPVDRRLKYPHPMSASVDHIVPMALGGGHTYTNTQCSHWICNCTKSHHGTGDQLALIG